ncbi:MAG: hypothetical protein Cons2KO_02210 [Congregibacter sp.]
MIEMLTEACGVVDLISNHCGATTHFDMSEAFKSINPSVDHVGVNMRLFDHSDLTGVEVRYPDGANWSGWLALC